MLHLLKIGRGKSVKLAALQRCWAKISPQLKWEALKLKLLAADFGIAPYVSREWLAEAMRETRRCNTATIKKHLEYLRQQAEAAALKAAKIAARRDDDIFAITVPPEKETAYYNILNVLRNGKIVENHTVCKQGTRLFCQKTGMTIKQHYTRKKIRECLAGLQGKANDRDEWLKSHNFHWLFHELGLQKTPDAA
ncbi:hypothetical protein OH491_24345 [Termitidicoccus mucosus]